MSVPNRRSGAARLLAAVRCQGAAFAVALVLGLGLAALPLAPPSAAAAGPKVAIIVGPSGSATSGYRRLAKALAAETRRYTSHVVVVRSPKATWSRVQSALSGSALVIYLGRGRGFPSRYSSSLVRTTQNGFGLNPRPDAGNGKVRWHGEAYVRKVHLASNAVVVLSRAAFASGAGEPGDTQPSRKTARARADNYAAGFLDAGAAAVIAERKGSLTYYVRQLLGTSRSVAEIWRRAPTANGNISTTASRRTAGALVRIDPRTRSSGFVRSIAGWPATSTTAVRDPTYGSAIAADNLNNTHIGGPKANAVSYRFRSTAGGRLAAVRVYIVDGSGYGAGTGGILRITVEPDDGSSDHVPSGTVLATTDVVHPVAGAGNRYAFAAPPALTAGRLYHIVFRNIDPAPESNYVSVDGLFVYRETATWQPAYANTDWANLVRAGGGAWTDERGAGRGTITPILGLEYADGTVGGVGYIEIWYAAEKEISGDRAARESFTVRDASRRVSSVSVRLRRLSGSSPLRVRLETADGGLVDQGEIPASAITPDDHPAWATLTFESPHTLEAGRAYRLVLTSAVDTAYGIFVIRKGSSYGYGSSTWFADGSAQYNPGSGWVAFDPGWRGPLDEGDLQFYFR